MAEKMFKKLDLSNVKIYKNTNEDLLSAMDLIGQEVYVSDEEDFESYQKLELAGAKKVKGSPFCYVARTYDGINFGYKYFILAKDAKFKGDKKLRPYKDISEFCNETGCEEVGVDVITIRNKSSKQEYVLLYVGYSDDTVHLGGYLITLKALFENYEFLYGDEWLPFGV